MSFNKEKVKKELLQSLEVAMCKLHRIWSEIGICETQRQERSGTVMLHLRNLLDEMVNEEESLKNSISQRTEKYRRELDILTEELSMPEYKVKVDLSMLQLEKDLKLKCETLALEKRERMKALQTLKEEDQKLCDLMCLTPYYIPTGTTPSAEQLEALEKHVNSLKTEKVKRFTEFVNIKKGIVVLFQEMDRTPESDFERDVICEEDNTFQLSEDNLKSLRLLKTELEELLEDLRQESVKMWDRIHVLWDRLAICSEDRATFSGGKEGVKPIVMQALKEEIARCEKLKYEHMQRFVDSTRRELSEWWDKCYFSQQQRDAFKPFQISDDYTEQLLELHDLEVVRVRQIYNNHRQLYENVACWEVLFTQMLEFERKACDPNRFNNRGGNLLQEEKARKKLLKELPKVEEEVKENIADWEKAQGQQFLVEGERFMEYIESRWTRYQKEKIKEKEDRSKAKAKLMEEEVFFGSKPNTPAKRRFLGTPSKTPSKMRKLNDGGVSVQMSLISKGNDTTRTPGSCSRIASCSRIQHSSVFASPYRKPPASTSKLTPAGIKSGKIARRRSNRIARKVLSEKNTQDNHAVTNETMFSHTTVSSCFQPLTNTGELSVVSTGDYKEFEREIKSRPYCRSSILPSPGKKVC
ncbi:Protein regulator of cytokinesis 1 [Mizuhopecten yessoensis]|uniref:Protein regulator of cytokinesis 1 n=1 Tax=Mizuhopecten yessoensis TaxID=6573 RepID=A0A210QPX3_MIZYE|nr:Protein regulator of cytokinesis 1 [Mizuhopecten yessoensis]